MVMTRSLQSPVTTRYTPGGVMTESVLVDTQHLPLPERLRLIRASIDATVKAAKSELTGELTVRDLLPSDLGETS